MTKNVPKRELSSKTRIGLIVNPVAGMGGSVGLKGTDGQMRQRAVELGAIPVAPDRAREFLGRIRNMHRAVFAVSSTAAAEMVDAFLEGIGLEQQEVLDIDEEAFRQNRLASKLYGYLLGPGTTVQVVANAVGVLKTLLGVDALADDRLVGSDLGEEGILQLMDRYEETKIIVTPIGGNGFLFGRGNRQFSPRVLRRAGREAVIAVATSDKLLKLEALRVDTGDFALDQALSGYLEVIVGANETVKMEVRC